MTIRVDRLLVAVDGSRPSMQAGRTAIEIAHTVGATVRLLSVAVHDGYSGPPGDVEASQAVRTRILEGLERALRYLERYGDERGVPLERTLITDTSEPPFEVILSVAQSWPADVILIGRTSRAGPGRALLGSQTEHVLEFTNVPVIVVPEPTRTAL